MRNTVFGLIFWISGMIIVPAYLHALSNSGPAVVEIYLDTITYIDKKQNLDSLPFKTTNIEQLNFGNYNRVVYIKVSLDSTLHFLSIENAHLDYVYVQFFDDKKQDVASFETGDALPFDSRPLHTNFFVFPIPDRATHAVVSAQTQGVLVIPLRFFTLSEYVKQENTQRVMLWIFMGISISVFFSAAIIGIFLRNFDYMLYALYAFFFMIYIVLDFGVLFQYLWPKTPQCNRFVPILYALYMLALMIFQFIFFRTHRMSNRWLKYAFYLLMFWSICAMGINFYDYYTALMLLK